MRNKMTALMLSAAILLGCMSTAAFAAGVSIIMPADGAVISGDSIITQISAQTEADYAIDGSAVSAEDGVIDVSALPFGEHVLSVRADGAADEVKFILTAPGANKEILTNSSFERYTNSTIRMLDYYPGTDIFGKQAYDVSVQHGGTDNLSVYPVVTGAGIKDFAKLTTDKEAADCNDKGFAVCVTPETQSEPWFGFPVGMSYWKGRFRVEGIKVVETDILLNSYHEMRFLLSGLGDDNSLIFGNDGKIAGGDVSYPINEWGRLKLVLDYEGMTGEIYYNGELAKSVMLDPAEVANITEYSEKYTNYQSRIYTLTFPKPANGESLTAFDNFTIYESTLLPYVTDMSYFSGGKSFARTEWDDGLVSSSAESISLMMSGSIDARSSVKLYKNGQSVDCEAVISGSRIDITPKAGFDEKCSYTIVLEEGASAGGISYKKPMYQSFATSEITESKLMSPSGGMSIEEYKEPLEISAIVVGAESEVRAEIDGETVYTWQASEKKYYYAEIEPWGIGMGEHTLRLFADGEEKLSSVFVLTPENIPFAIVSPAANANIDEEVTAITVSSPYGTTGLELYLDGVKTAETDKRTERGISVFSIDKSELPYGNHSVYAKRHSASGVESCEEVNFSVRKTETATELFEAFDSSSMPSGWDAIAQSGGMDIQNNALHMYSRPISEMNYANPFAAVGVSAKSSDTTFVIRAKVSPQSSLMSFDYECKSGGAYYIVKPLNNGSVNGTALEIGKWYTITVTYNLAAGSYTVSAEGNGVNTSSTTVSGFHSIDSGSVRINTYYSGDDADGAILYDDFEMLYEINYPVFSGGGYVYDEKAYQSDTVPVYAQKVIAFLENDIGALSVTKDTVALFVNGKEVQLAGVGYSDARYVWAQPEQPFPPGADIRLVLKAGALFSDQTPLERDMVMKLKAVSGITAETKFLSADGTQYTEAASLKGGEEVYAQATVQNKTDAEASVVAVIAAYRDGKLVGISFSEQYDIPAGEQMEFKTGSRCV